jgi:oxygen-independent coproporphyrinogen-3 oxidase
VGFDHYEISNYARPGEQSRHNLGYWRGADYLGLGAGAWGTVARRASEQGAARVRYRNTPSTRRYREACGDWAALDPLIAAPDGPVATSEEIDPATALRERIMLCLRLAGGLDLDAAGRELGLNAWSARRRASVERLVALGRLERDGGVLRIPKSAWLLADGTIAELM